jgi:hypothetical protein
MQLYEEYILVAFAIAFLAAFWVWRDANSNWDENAAWWALGTFLLLVIVLPLYLYHRAYGNTLLKEARQWTFCKFCGEAIPPHCTYCPLCDRALV